MALVRTVIVTEELTGEQVGLRLVSTHMLVLFAQYQPYPGSWIDVRYRWKASDHGYQRWRVRVDRPKTLDCSPRGKDPTRRLGTGERHGAIAFA
jgi:hypothetical protein